MEKNEKIKLINEMLETIGLSTETLDGVQRRNAEYVFNNYLELNPELKKLDAVNVDRFIQNLFDINYLIEKNTHKWEYNHFYIQQIYDILIGKR